MVNDWVPQLRPTFSGQTNNQIRFVSSLAVFRLFCFGSWTHHARVHVLRFCRVNVGDSLAEKKKMTHQPRDIDFRIYTDGSCIGNGKKHAGAGASGCAVHIETTQRDPSASAAAAPSSTKQIEWTCSLPLGKGTNNIAELSAILLALDMVRCWQREWIASGLETVHSFRDRMVYIYTDSTYTIGSLSKSWNCKANRQLIKTIRVACDDFQPIQWIHVKAHNGHRQNELVNDEAIRQARSPSILPCSPEERCAAPNTSTWMLSSSGQPGLATLFPRTSMSAASPSTSATSSSTSPKASSSASSLIPTSSHPTHLSIALETHESPVAARLPDLARSPPPTTGATIPSHSLTVRERLMHKLAGSKRPRPDSFDTLLSSPLLSSLTSPSSSCSATSATTDRHTAAARVSTVVWNTLARHDRRAIRPTRTPKFISRSDPKS